MNRSMLSTTILVLLLMTGIGRAEVKSGSSKAVDKNSYSLGYQFGSNLKKQPVDLDLETILSGLRDAFQGASPKVSENEMQDAIKTMKKDIWVAEQKRFQEQAAENLRKGEAFLSANGKKDGVITLPSGLQYKVIEQGEGPKPRITDSVTLNYRGTLIDGTEFDNSSKRSEPATVRLLGMIDGWQEAIPLMHTGSKWQLFVPAKLAYGERPFGRIPPNSVLNFEVELVAVDSSSGIAASDKHPPEDALPTAAAQADSQKQQDRTIDPPYDLKIAVVRGGFKLTWKPSPNDPGIVSGYEILRARNTSTGPESGPFSVIGSVAKGVFEYSDLTALPDYIYYYKVRAIAGTRSSAESNVVHREW